MASGRLWEVCQLPTDAVTALVDSVPVALVAQREITAEISRSEATRHHGTSARPRQCPPGRRVPPPGRVDAPGQPGLEKLDQRTRTCQRCGRRSARSARVLVTRARRVSGFLACSIQET